MSKKHTLFLIFSLLLVAGLIACSAGKPPAATAEKVKTETAPPDCNRTCLEGFANQYMEALVAHDPSRAPLAKNVKFTENGQELAVGDALWATASDLPTAA